MAEAGPGVAVIWMAVVEPRITAMAVIGVAETGVTREMVDNDNDSDSKELDGNARDDVRLSEIMLSLISYNNIGLM